MYSSASIVHSHYEPATVVQPCSLHYPALGVVTLLPIAPTVTIPKINIYNFITLID
jgi:hypothetical protein